MLNDYFETTGFRNENLFSFFYSAQAYNFVTHTLYMHRSRIEWNPGEHYRIRVDAVWNCDFDLFIRSSHGHSTQPTHQRGEESKSFRITSYILHRQGFKLVSA